MSLIRAKSDHRLLLRPALEFCWPTEGAHFQLTSMASKHDHLVCLQTAGQRMFCHRRKENSAVHHFRPREATPLSLLSFSCDVSSCTFWNFNGFTTSSFFNICLMEYCDMFSSQALFLPLPRRFCSSRFFTFRTISANVAVFYRPLT